MTDLGVGTVGDGFQFRVDEQRWRLRLHPVSALVAVVGVIVFAAFGLLRFTSGETANAQHAPAAVEQSRDADSPQVSEPGYGLTEGASGGGEDADGGELGGSDSQVIVHVTGAVGLPGVVQVPAQSRVVDAVEAAGGLRPEADLTSVNLAAFVSDGSHIHVAAEGEAPLATGDSAAAAPGGGGCVDLNSADLNALQDLDGIGPKLAQRILDHREANGPFTSVEQLTEVSGIGAVMLERVRVGVCE